MHCRCSGGQVHCRCSGGAGALQVQAHCRCRCTAGALQVHCRCRCSAGAEVQCRCRCNAGAVQVHCRCTMVHCRCRCTAGAGALQVQVHCRCKCSAGAPARSRAIPTNRKARPRRASAAKFKGSAAIPRFRKIPRDSEKSDGHGAKHGLAVASIPRFRPFCLVRKQSAGENATGRFFKNVTGGRRNKRNVFLFRKETT